MNLPGFRENTGLFAQKRVRQRVRLWFQGEKIFSSYLPEVEDVKGPHTPSPEFWGFTLRGEDLGTLCCSEKEIGEGRDQNTSPDGARDPPQDPPELSQSHSPKQRS